MKIKDFELYKDLAKGALIKWSLFLKWVVAAGVIGIVVGLVGTAFSYGMQWAQ